MWYAILTKPGKEEFVRDLIRETVPKKLYSGLRILRRESQRRYLGEWHTEIKPMFRGCVFVITNQADAFEKALPKYLTFAGLVSPEQPLTAVCESEAAILQQLTGGGELVGISSEKCRFTNCNR